MVAPPREALPTVPSMCQTLSPPHLSPPGDSQTHWNKAVGGQLRGSTEAAFVGAAAHLVPTTGSRPPLEAAYSEP